MKLNPNTENKYTHISPELRVKFKRSNIDIDGILQAYETARGEYHIQTLYRVNEEQLNHILKACLTPEIINKRERAIKNNELNNGLYVSNIGTDINSIEKLSLKEAIALVEEGEDR